MLKNLSLLEKHKKRMSLIAALITFLFIGFSIVFLEVILSQFQSNKENEALKEKVEAVLNTIINNEVFEKYNDDDSINRVLNKILQDTYIRSQKGEIISSIDNEVNKLRLPLKRIVYYKGYKYYSTSVESQGEDYFVLVRVGSKDFYNEYITILISFLIFSPILYGVLFFIWSKVMTIVYNPIKNMIVNLESFAGNLNHEFKTSISEILSTLELAKMTQDFEEANDFAIRSTKKLNNILDVLGLFIYFTNSDYRKQKIDIISLLDKDILEFRSKISEKNIKIVKIYNPKNPIFKVIDKEPLILCFRNILKNAIRYSHENGNIEISINKNSFIIKDYGVGIEKENLGKIFRRYFRENYSVSGFGIGLSLVQKITEIYAWEVKIESEKNKFTKVTLKFDDNK